jgi:hypothetical protein
MALLDRYLHAVRKRLPREARDDIAAELRAILLSQIEAEEVERGRSLADDEVAAILTSYGPPETVAARYGAREHLIGPVVFRHYAFVVKVMLWILGPLLSLWAVATAFTADDPAAATARVLGIAVIIVLGNLAIVTLLFARLERLKDQLEWAHRWDPRQLSWMPELPQSLPRSEAVASLLLMIVWLLWWTDVLPLNRWLLGPLYVAPAPIWDTLDSAILALMVAGITIDAVAVARPRWVMVHEVASVLLDIGILVVLYHALRAPALVVVADPTNAGARLIEPANAGLFIFLLVWAVVVVVILGLTVCRLVARVRVPSRAHA